MFMKITIHLGVLCLLSILPTQKIIHTNISQMFMKEMSVRSRILSAQFCFYLMNIEGNKPFKCDKTVVLRVKVSHKHLFSTKVFEIIRLPCFCGSIQFIS